MMADVSRMMVAGQRAMASDIVVAGYCIVEDSRVRHCVDWDTILTEDGELR